MYMCSLKGKEGELRALKQLDINKVNPRNFLPFLTLTDTSEKFFKKLYKNYPSKILISPAGLTSDELSEVLLIIENYDNMELVYTIEKVANDSDIVVDTIIIDENNINTFFLKWLEKNTKLLPKNIILDFGFIQEKLKDKTDKAINFLKVINNYEVESNIFILSGSVPYPIPVPTTENYKQDMFELEFYNSIKNNFPKLNIFYADYATSTPIEVKYDNQPIIANVQIKYSSFGEFNFIRNGQRRGNYNFVKVCEDLKSEFNPLESDFCWANKYINTTISLNENRGNPSVWVSLGINHHITVFALELSK